MNKTVSFCNLGCKVNAYETEAISSQLKRAGYDIVEFGQPSYITIINTCTVTGIADKKSRQMIHRAKKMAPNGIIVAMGCYVQVMTKEQRDKESAIDLFIGNKEKARLVEILNDYLDKKNNNVEDITNVYVDDINDGKCEYEDLVLTGTTKHTRAYMKIQDGCNQFCSYCLIPYARGRVRSKDLQVVYDEFESLLAKGYKEIVLTGIHLGSYGLEKENLSLTDVIKKITPLQDKYGVYRLRLGSLEPRTITTEFLNALKEIKGFCPHFHLSLQSGCEKTLKAMNRKYLPSEFKDKCNLIRKYWENAALTTDVIVGFPGETDEDFEESRRFVEDINFAQTHIFKYSKRQGTIAARREGQVNDSIKHNRSQVLLSLDAINRKKFIDKFIGKEIELLIEESKCVDGKWYDIGHTPEYLQVLVPIDEHEKEKRDNTYLKFVLDDSYLVH